MLEALERRLLLYDVTNTNDSGLGSLRQAILDLNAAPANGERIIIRVAGGTEAQPKRIELFSALPVITKPTIFEYRDIPARSVLITTAAAVRGQFDGIVSTVGIGMNSQAISGFRHGMVLSGANCEIGNSYIYNRNAIFGNSGDGVRFIGNGSGYVRMTDLYDNGGLAIDNGGDGSNPNDPGDTDTGNNDKLNSPTLLWARIEEENITVSFSTQDLPAGWINDSHFDFFVGSDTRSGAVGQGGKLAATSTFGSGVIKTYSFRIPTVMPANPIVTASFTQVGRTGELSVPVRLEGLPIYVTTTADSGPGSLREAITLANSNSGFDNIHFHLARGQRQINLLSPLPEITGPVLIDGNSATTGPEDRVRINGSGAPANADGLVISSSQPCIVRGMGITGFRHGIVINSGNGHLIGQEWAWGFDPGWNYIYRNRGDGIRVNAGTDHNLRYNNLAYNGGLPIDLGGDGADPVDAGDSDTGPNGRLNAPLFDQAYLSGNRVNVLGTLRGQGGESYVVDFWALPAVDSGEAFPKARYLDDLALNPVATPADRQFGYSAYAGNESLVGGTVFATVSLGFNGATSETGSVLIRPDQMFNVVSTADSGPGTLRQALLDANATPGLNTIRFFQPTSAVIELTTPLPDITEAVEFTNGATIAAAAAVQGMFDGLVVSSSGSTISSMTFSGFRHGIAIRGNSNRLMYSRVYGNSGDGVRIESGSGNTIDATDVIEGNGGLSINLGTDGVTPNDPLDADTGPNDLQNAPQLLGASSDYLRTRVTGRLDAKPNTVYRIDLFHCRPGGSAQMSTALANLTVTTDANGVASFDHVVQQSANRPTPADVVTAMATDPAGNVSELSAAIAVSGMALTVTNTSSSGPGSLYDAVGNANFYPGADTIHFDIPGAGPHRIIAPLGLPQITGTVTIDATTQPGYAGSPLMELMGPGHDKIDVLGIYIKSGARSAVRGMAIGGFGAGMYITAPDARVEASYVGLDSLGIAAPNGKGLMTNGERATIGGLVASARNIISGNVSVGLELSGNENVALGNFIGTNPAGVAATGNLNGVRIVGTSNVLGGTAAGARNVIAGNLAAGVLMEYPYVTWPVPAQSNRVLGNYIGLSANATALGNGGDGMKISSRVTSVGGLGAGEANIIAFNKGAGIRVIAEAKFESGYYNSIRGNAIHGNSALAIDLQGDGSSGNDMLDLDSGPNEMQNHPVIGSISTDGSSTRVSGSINSVSLATFTLDFYASPADGSGQQYLGSTTVTTDNRGNGSFTATFPGVVAAGQLITATATSASGSTSEFSPAMAVPIASAPVDVVANAVDASATGASLTPAPVEPISEPAVADIVTVVEAPVVMTTAVPAARPAAPVETKAGAAENIPVWPIVRNTPFATTPIGKVALQRRPLSTTTDSLVNQRGFAGLMPIVRPEISQPKTPRAPRANPLFALTAPIKGPVKHNAKLPRPVRR